MHRTVLNAMTMSFIFFGLVGCGHSECQHDSDCGSGQSCVYPTSDGCAAKGMCEDAPSGTNCNLVQQFCACDGSMVSVGCGMSGASVPVQSTHAGSCPHGMKDAGGPCRQSADCGLNQGCYFPIADGCSAVGVCLEDNPGHENECDTLTTYCACNGGGSRSVCGGHSGYISDPVSGTFVSLGVCSGPLLPDAGAQK
jgi:hypothetical protein